MLHCLQSCEASSMAKGRGPCGRLSVSVPTRRQRIQVCSTADRGKQTGGTSCRRFELRVFALKGKQKQQTTARERQSTSQTYPDLARHIFDMHGLPKGCIAKSIGTVRRWGFTISLTREELSEDCSTIFAMSVWRYPKSRPSWLVSFSVNTERDSPDETESDQGSPSSTSDGGVPDAPTRAYCLSRSPSEIETIWCEEDAENNPDPKPTHVYVLHVVYQPKEHKRSPVPLLLQKEFNKENAQESLQAFWNWAMVTFNVASPAASQLFGVRILGGWEVASKLWE